MAAVHTLPFLRSKMGQLFRDMLGRVNQRIAEYTDEVMLLVAGLPWKLK